MGYTQILRDGGVLLKFLEGSYCQGQTTSVNHRGATTIVYVDDMIFAATTEEGTKIEVTIVLSHFDGTDEGPLS